MNRELTRRQFLGKTGAWLGAGALAAGAAPLWGTDRSDRPVRIGLVGVGRRGTSLLRNLLRMEGVRISAICDIDETNLNRALQMAGEAGQARSEAYGRGPEDYKRMCERADLDAVITATPWDLHTPVMLSAMRAGKYGATEVNAGITVDECWDLVETSEQTGMPCMMLENVCYFQNVMMILNMVRQGLLGELIHCEAGYQHDVRARGKFIEETGELRWRGEFATRHDGNLYPTHPIGPVAQWLDINRGNRFDYLVSMSSKARGMNRHIEKKWGPDHPNATRAFKNGDVNVTLLRTVNGETVTLYHDTQLPRPYDLILRAQGTDGICMGYEKKIFLEPSPGQEQPGQSSHDWEDLEKYREQYEHPVWRARGEAARGSGHGGSDYLTLYAFVKAVRERTQTPIDVYDSATWSVIFPLSEQSAASRSRSVDFPDFTRGKWKTRRPLPLEAL